MTRVTDFDLQSAHKYFSVQCFNKAWDLIGKSDRSLEEEEQMVQLSMSSLWHWTQREDFTDTNASIAFWQLARVYALLERVPEARRYAKLCLDVSQKEGVEPFFLAYAYEALARAEMTAGNPDTMQAYLAAAHKAAESISEVDEREMVLADLRTIK